MAETTIVARPYAKAVFEIARDDQAFAEWAGVLALTSEVVEDEGFHELMHSPAQPGNVDPVLSPHGALLRLHGFTGDEDLVDRSPQETLLELGIGLRVVPNTCEVSREVVETTPLVCVEGRTFLG